MPEYWILKTEPSTYSYDRLAREQTAVWDGVTNALALKHIRRMKRGDRTLIYHTGAEKAVVGIAAIVSDPYPDPKAQDPKIVVVKVQAVKKLAHPVPLARIKADRAFADLALVRMGRLSVMPATATQWRRLVQLGGA